MCPQPPPGEAGFISVAHAVYRRRNSSTQTTPLHMHAKPLFREAQKGSSQSIISLPCKFLPGLLRAQHYIEMSSVYPSSFLLSVAQPIFLNVASPLPAPSECSGFPWTPIADFLAFLLLARSSGFQIDPCFTCLAKGSICCSYLSQLTLRDSMGCSPPGSSVHGILQATIYWSALHPFLQGIFLTQGSNSSLLH